MKKFSHETNQSLKQEISPKQAVKVHPQISNQI